MSRGEGKGRPKNDIISLKPLFISSYAMWDAEAKVALKKKVQILHAGLIFPPIHPLLICALLFYSGCLAL